jgi:hypothetical protein
MTNESCIMGLAGASGLNSSLAGYSAVIELGFTAMHGPGSGSLPACPPPASISHSLS